MSSDYKKKLEEVLNGITPHGKIISPLKGATTGTVVNVTGKIKNIDDDHYLWLIVEKPFQELCWPKAPIAKKKDLTFTAVAYEEGVPGPYTLSLLAVDETTNAHLLGWIYSRRYKGLPSPPEHMRLDSVELIKGDDIPGRVKEAHKLFSQYQDKKAAARINELLIKMEKKDNDRFYKILEDLNGALE